MKFQPAVEFPVFIDGKPAIAYVLEEIDHPVQTFFQIAFSDGFEDRFTVEDDRNVYGSGIASIPYAKARRFDIVNLIGLDPNLFYYNYPESIDGMKANVWVIEGNCGRGEPIYKVFYFEYFRFALQRADEGWEILHKSPYGKMPGPAMVKKVSFLLDSLLKASSK